MQLCCMIYICKGGDSMEADNMGMTNEQYKGMLLDELEDWEEVKQLAEEAGNKKIKTKADKQIKKINEKLKF